LGLVEEGGNHASALPSRIGNVRKLRPWRSRGSGTSCPSQAKPPVYYVAEVDIADQAAYSTYVPKAQAAIKAAGGKFLAAGGTITPIDGEPPKTRVVIQQWDSLEKYRAYRDSAAFKDLLPMREKVAKWRAFVVEGVPQ
jgi:uncharacterized protein (DUF1330 family)